MAKKKTNFLVGLFVILGVIIGVCAIIWVGATSYFQKGQSYVAYFDESVQGLQVDSGVKYRGVEVGRVEKIRVAPDNKLIAVVMKINLRDDISKKIVAQLKVAGITGLVFVELDRKKPDEPDLSPKLSFPSEYPVVASRPSEMQKIVGGVNAVVEKLNQMDTEGVFAQLKSTAAEVEIFFRGKRMESILTKTEATLANVQSITGRVDKIVGGGRLEEVIVEARDALKGTRALVATIQDEVRGMNLREAVTKTKAISQELEATMENLRRTSETLETFMGRINERPSDLLFGKPPKGRWNEATQ